MTIPPNNGEQTVLPLNPAWTAPVVAVDGRFWLATTADALLHPSAHGSAFRAGAVEYRCATATRLGGLIRATCATPVLLPPDHPILLEVHP